MAVARAWRSGATSIALVDAKAQAKLLGSRITAASVSAAQRLLSRQETAAAPAAKPAADARQRPALATRRPRGYLQCTAQPQPTERRRRHRGVEQSALRRRPVRVGRYR
jgi:hypothetical protein